MPKFNPHYVQEEMRCRANHNSDSNLPLNSPTRISSPTGTHNTHLGFLHTLSGTAQEFHVHLLPQSCMFYRQSVNWSEFYSRFSRYFCRALHMQTVSPQDTRPTVETICRDILQDILLQLLLCSVPLTGQDLPWTVLTSSTEPSIAEWEALLLRECSLP